MECPKCGYREGESGAECIKCGIVFDKYEKARRRKAFLTTGGTEGAGADRSDKGFFHYLLYTKDDIDPLMWAGRVAIFLVLLIWGWKHILSPIESNYGNESFMHLINLPFHEAGHIFFSPFGRFMTSLGGSLMQIIIPMLCLFVLLIKTRDTYGASVALWWAGENFIDLAPYINDARSLTLPLIGGNVGHSTPYGFHDWEFILTETGLLAHDHVIARISFCMGSAVMIVSMMWGAVLLFQQYKNLERWSD